MKSDSWASYQSALPPEARAGGEPDDGPEPAGRHDREPPAYLIVTWFASVPCDEWRMECDPEAGTYAAVLVRSTVEAPVGRWFPAEGWAFKHAAAWRDAMARRHGWAAVEEVF